LLGPPSVGKRTLAQQIVEYHEIAQVLEFYEGVSMDEARAIRAFLSESVESRAVILRLDPVRSEVSHLLLKTIEELGEGRHVIFLAVRQPLATILSRAWVYRCGYLSDPEMAQILFDQGVSPANIPLLVAYGRGQVSVALGSLDVEIEKAPIIALLRATAEGDEVMFGKVVSRSREEHLHLLRVWASEASTGMWRLFEPRESYGLEPYASGVGRALESRARARLLIRAVMGRLMEVSR
jgi:hypothetical protein